MARALAVLLIALIVSGLCVIQPATGSPTMLSLGSIAINPKEEVAKFQPLADYLARQLKPLGVQQGRVVVLQTIAEMAQALRAGDVDMYIGSPFPAIVVSDRSGAKPTLRRWKKGRADYYTVIVARRDSGIQRPSDLKGKVIAFEDNASTSGYLLPMASLAKQGIALLPVSDPSQPIPKDRLGYVFSGEHETTMFWILEGRVAAGAVDDQSFEKLAGERIGELKIILRTISVPRHIVVLRGDLNPRWASALQETLVTMDLTEEGQLALRQFESTTKFDAFPQGPEIALRPVRELMRYLSAQLGR